MLGFIPDVDKFHKIKEEQMEEVAETEDIEESQEMNMLIRRLSCEKT